MSRAGLHRRRARPAASGSASRSAAIPPITAGSTSSRSGRRARWAEFVCIAEDPLRTGIDREEVARQARLLAREADREARKWARDLARSRTPVAAIDDVLDHAAEQAAQVVSFPAPPRSTGSDGVDAALAAQDAADEADAPREQRQTGTGGRARVLAAMRRFHREEIDD